MAAHCLKSDMCKETVKNHPENVFFKPVVIIITLKTKWILINPITNMVKCTSQDVNDNINISGDS